MSSTRKTKTVEIPEEFIDDVESLMERLALEKKKGNNIPKYDREDAYEVKMVKEHRIVKGKWQFLVKFLDGSLSWIDDDKCDCDYLISKYLETKGINTAYLVCRVSTDDQSKGLSLDAQEKELKKAVAEYGDFARVKVYRISGSAYRNIPRPICDISDSVISGDGVFVWRVDRLSRNIVKFMSVIEKMHEKGVSIYSHNEKLTYSTEKLKFIQAILDAQKEANVLGERVKLALNLKKQRGDYIGNAPFGYRIAKTINKKTKVTKRVKLDNPKEQEVVTLINQEIRRRTARSVADLLNSKRLLKRGKLWKPSMVRGIAKKYRGQAPL